MLGVLGALLIDLRLADEEFSLLGLELGSNSFFWW
jgi:hypothetical protein